MPNTTTLVFSGIPIEVTKKKVKQFRIRISRRTGKVMMSIPLSASDAALKKVLNDRLDWIRAHRPPPVPERSYVSGELVRYFGELRPLVVKEGKKRSASIGDDGEVILVCRTEDTAERRREILFAWYRAETLRAAQALQPALSEMSGLYPSSIRIGRAISRWGTCQTPSNIVTLSLHLAEHPPSCLEFVLMHELVHIRWHGHGKRFYDTLTRLMPDWRERKKLLRDSNIQSWRDWMPEKELPS